LENETILIVGAGPAGLEAARALGQRGYAVTLAETKDKLGGRVHVESQLPGLSQWARVADYRTYQISQMANVDVYRNSPLTADQVLEFHADHIVLATGSKWDTTGIGRSNRRAISGHDLGHVMSADVICAGAAPIGPVVIFDDDYYYMAGLLAEKLCAEGHDVTYVTPAPDVSHWTHNTMEQRRIQTKLMKTGVTLIPLHNLAGIHTTHVDLICVYTGAIRELECGTLIPIAMRNACSDLFDALQGQAPSVMRIGDCHALGTIAAAVYAGHRYARELGAPPQIGAPFRRELPLLARD
jgi:dimethylamine/trimethylamine dehydrogenase